MEQTARKWAGAWEARARLRMIQHDEHATRLRGVPGAAPALGARIEPPRATRGAQGQDPGEAALRASDFCPFACAENRLTITKERNP